MTIASPIAFVIPYSFPETGPDRIEVIVTDVKGHGVPAALVASMIKVSTDRHALAVQFTFGDSPRTPPGA